MNAANSKITDAHDECEISQQPNTTQPNEPTTLNTIEKFNLNHLIEHESGAQIIYSDDKLDNCSDLSCCAQPQLATNHLADSLHSNVPNRTEPGYESNLVAVGQEENQLALASDQSDLSKRIVPLSCTPAPDVKIGQRVAYKEYYGNEFGTIRWIGRVPQISADWTVGVEFDNAIGEGDGSLNGRRYFIAKDCFAKFLPLDDVALVDQHVGRPEPGTMISVMSASVRPGQMISIQRVSTVHVQHCFLNAPHRIPGADLLAVNTRLHCQCPSCGPCAHVVKPPRTQRLRTGKNATHMCQFSTYTCCGMQSQEETMCTYTGNKVTGDLLPPPISPSCANLPPPIGNSWIQGSGYLTNLQAQQSKLMPDEYRLGAGPDDVGDHFRRGSGGGSGRPKISSRHKSSEHRHRSRHHKEKLRSPGDEYHHYAEDQPPSHEDPSHPSKANKLPQSASDAQVVETKHPAYKLSENTADREPKTSRVMYRDSIENRYLFPTDETAIDPSLEADLEDLSEARYGRCTNTRHHPGGIMRTLRDLVSCLTTKSNRSDIYDQNPSENIVGYYEQPHFELHKSQPALKGTCDSRSLRDESDRDFDRDKYGQYCDLDHRSDSPLGIKNIDASSSRYASTMNSFDCTSNRAELRISATNTELKSAEMSSSSDCGFSSGSQNSANIFTYPSCSPTLSLDGNHLNQLYRRVVARLRSSSTSFTQDDLLKLKRALFEAHCERRYICSDVQMDSLVAGTTSECDEVVESIIRRSCLDSLERQTDQLDGDQCCHRMRQKSGEKTNIRSTEHHEKVVSSQHAAYSRPFEASNFGQRRARSCEPVDSSPNLQSNGSCDLNETSNDSGAAAEACRLDERDRDELLKTFELKLTLSIKSDKNLQATKIETRQIADELAKVDSDCKTAPTSCADHNQGVDPHPPAGPMATNDLETSANEVQIT